MTEEVELNRSQACLIQKRHDKIELPAGNCRPMYEHKWFATRGAINAVVADAIA